MTDQPDNVSRLEKIAKTMEAGHWVSLSKAVRDAAAEIERLRAELVSTTNKLTAERDEARRIACEKEAWLRRENGSARDHAERMGWDCFKGETP